jgi:hypothetical protein
MFWILMLLVLLVFGLPMMLLFAALSVGVWIVGAVLGLVWAVLTFVFNDAATACWSSWHWPLVTPGARSGSSGSRTG